MAFQNGLWGEFVHERNHSMRALASELTVDRRTLYRFLDGDLSRLGVKKRALLAKLLKLRTTAALVRKIQQVNQMKGQTP